MQRQIMHLDTQTTSKQVSFLIFSYIFCTCNSCFLCFLYVWYFRGVTFLVGSSACLCPNFLSQVWYIACGVSFYRLSRVLIWKITFPSVKKNAGPSLKIWKQKHRPMAVNRPNMAFASVDNVCARECVSNDDVTGLPFIFLEVKVKLKLFWFADDIGYRSGCGWRLNDPEYTKKRRRITRNEAK